MVMSSVVSSGCSSWKRSTASSPLPASPTTSWPPLVSASLTILRMNAASSTTSTRAIQATSFAAVLFVRLIREIDSMRTAQSEPSTTTSRPVAKRRPLT